MASSAKPAATTRPTASSARPTSAQPTKTAAIKTPEKETKQKSVPAQKEKKPAKKSSARPEGGGAGTAVLDFVKSRNGIITIAVAAFVIILALVLGLSLGLSSCASAKEVFVNEYKNNSIVGYSSEVLGTTERHKPVAETKDEHLPSGYPKYGYTLQGVIGSSDEQQAARAALIDESDYLTAYGTRNNSGNGNNGAGTYNMMDENGYLYFVSNGTKTQAKYDDGTPRQLYKHTAAVGMYYGGINDANPDLSDDEPGIIKQVTLRPRGYGSYSVTGVYAPAGEVIKIEISEEDMNATGGITIHIGQALYNGQSNNIWVAKGQMQRFPNILNTMVVNKDTATLKDGVYTAYVGSFIGGPLYIRNTVAEFTAKISGGVAYSHFILGYTTKEEFEENKKSTAPYFDLEVWNYGVLHSGPKFFSQKYSYEDLYKVAVLWEKVSLVTTTGSNQGIVFLYDAFVAAGAAVAFPGRSSVNCPAGWMDGSLNYNGIVSSGSWGNFHEYHHNFQSYGVGNGGEVTNNGMTLVSYALFTKISAARGISGYGAAGLGGWNRYTSATWALDQILENKYENGKQGLALYATLLHNFGPDAYIQSKVRQQTQRYGQSYAGYLRAWQDITHNDMSYFFNDLLGGGVGDAYKNPDYSLFVPVSSVYQTGRSYMYDGEKKYITTMQPYVIPYGEDFTVDLSRYNAPSGQYASGSIILPDDFEYTIKESEIKQPEHGTLKANGNNIFTFTPDETLKSGKIIIPLEIKHKTNASIKVDDVDLVIEFEQSHETNKAVLTRTTYTYDAADMYEDAQVAYENNYANYSNKVEADHKNPVQNCNTDVWFYPDTPAAHEQHPDAPDEYFVKDNTVVEVRGKLYAEDEGNYRLYLRGRMNCAFYYSIDGGATYVEGGKIKDKTVPGNSAQFRPGDANTYVDIYDLPKQSWIYFKSVLIVQSSPTVSYMGMGLTKWTTPMFTMREDEKGNIHYYNYLGIEVTEEEANNAKPVPPTSASYANAYRETYESVTGEFETDYFYTRKYSYSYTDNVWQNKEQTLLTEGCKYSQGPSSWGGSGKGTGIENVADGDRNTWIHTSGGVSEQNPLVIAMDMGEAKTVNRINIFSQFRPNGDFKVPTAFKLMGSLDGNTFFTVGDFTDVTHNGANVTIDFEEATFRYYQLIITSSYSTHIIISEIELWKVFEVNSGNMLSPDNETLTFKGKWQTVSTSANFGHVYTGKKNATVTFEFEGTRLAVLSSKHYGTNFEIRIDGKKVESIDLIPFENLTTDTGCAYMSAELASGNHKVEIKCKGDANIDAIVVFP